MMKKFATFTAVLVAGVLTAQSALALCTTIQDGGLVDSIGDPISVGYDEWGYNYQAHMFNSDYCDAGRGVWGCPIYDTDVERWIDVGEVDLMMTWNDAWLANKSCDDDNSLDRHLGSASYKGSGAWLTNHMSGKVEINGKLRKWTYFVKIIAVPTEATEVGGYWLAADGTEIGESIWGPFAIIQEVSNDPSKGAHGILYNSPAHPGLGNL